MKILTLVPVFFIPLEAMPSTGVTLKMRTLKAYKKNHRLQVARPAQLQQAADLHAPMVVSSYEALVGARMLVTVSSGLKRRVYRVNVPPVSLPEK